VLRYDLSPQDIFYNGFDLLYQIGCISGKSKKLKTLWESIQPKSIKWLPDLLGWLVDKSKTDKAITMPIKHYILMSRKELKSFLLCTFDTTYIYLGNLFANTNMVCSILPHTVTRLAFVRIQANHSTAQF
jgi:hypothetical protein